MRPIILTLTMLFMTLMIAVIAQGAIFQTNNTGLKAPIERLNTCLDSTSMHAKTVGCLISFKKELTEAGFNPQFVERITDKIAKQLFGETEI